MWYALVAAAVCFIFWLYRKRAGRSKVVTNRALLLLGSGTSWSMRQVTREGFMLYDGPSQYPISDCILADVSAKLGAVYVLAADSVVLVDYEQFSRIKETAVKGALFKAGGDLNHLIQIVASVLVIVAAVYSFMQTSAVNGSLVQQQAQINKLTEILSKPLVVAK